VNDTSYSATPRHRPAARRSITTARHPQTLTFDFTPTTAATANAPPTDTWTMNITDSASAIRRPRSVQTLAGLCRHRPDCWRIAIGNPTAGTYDPMPERSASPPVVHRHANQYWRDRQPEGMTQPGWAVQHHKCHAERLELRHRPGRHHQPPGIVTATFSNGATRPIYQLDLANVSKPGRSDSGRRRCIPTVAGRRDTAAVSGWYRSGRHHRRRRTRGSNVDLSTELTNLIATQNAILPQVR